MKKLLLLIFYLILLSEISISYAELGTPELEISASVSPYKIEKGGTGTLIVNVSEVGGEDWAKNVVVKPYCLDNGIFISPSKSSPVDIDKYGSATFTFTINVNNSALEGVKTIHIDVDYIDTGWLNIGEDDKSKSATTTFEVISSTSDTSNYPTNDYSYNSDGYISVDSNVYGADVYVDGAYIGKTPIADYPITSGSHTISVEKEGYESYTEYVNVNSGETYNIYATLTKSYGYLNVYSNPTDADVYVDGYYEGKTPLHLTLTPGIHSVEVKKDEYYPYSTDVYINSGDSKKINAELKPKFGYLTVYSLEGAEIYIDGKYVGHPPLRSYKLSIGNHNIEIKKEEYNTYSTDIYINSGDSKTIKAKLTPKYGYLTVYSYLGVPCDIYLNNKWIGTTPITKHDVKPGFYHIECKIGELPIYESSISIKNGEYKKLDIELTNSYAGYYLGGSFALMGFGVVGLVLVRKRKQKNIGKKQNQDIFDFPSELLSKYIPLEKLGEGGFGKVFKVKRKSDGEIIALKIPNLDEKAKKYLLKEIKVWQNLNHPNIVRMFDAYEEPIPHIEMEYIDGYNLNGKLIRNLDEYPKPLNSKKSINLIKQIAEGLKHAHDKNIIHRDIKPSNILLTPNLIPKITDWGLAKIGAKSSTATTTKALTLLYSAPEQIDEEEYGKTDKRTDIYQLGVLFYELLTGRLPYEGTSPAQISLKIVNPDKKPLPPSKINPSLSIFDGLFERHLAKRKEDRFQSIDEFLRALKSIEELIKEKESLKNTLTQTIDKLKKSTDKKEIERLIRELVDSTTKLALNCAKVNDKVGLLEALETLKDYVKSEDNKKELGGAIKHIEYLIKEQIPIEKQTIEALEVLLSRIRREF